MSQTFNFTDAAVIPVTQAGIAGGVTSHRIITEQHAQHHGQLFQMGVFGISVSAISGGWGVRVVAYSPLGDTHVVAGMTGIVGGTSKAFVPNNLVTAGATFLTGLMRPAFVEYETAGGVSANFSASVWGVMTNP